MNTKTSKTAILYLLVGMLFLSGCTETANNEQNSPVTKSSEVTESGLWVTSERLNRRTCPNEKCGSVGQLFFREHASHLEEKGNWVRISKYYDASCKNGKSEYVDSGNTLCTPSNGIQNGQFAEWVSRKHLSTTRPADPGANATGDYALVKDSDNYSKYKDVFARSAKGLITNSSCTADDFKEMGGWMKSMNRNNEPIYFIYCGGMSLENKIYLDASTGSIFR